MNIIKSFTSKRFQYIKVFVLALVFVFSGCHESKLPIVIQGSIEGDSLGKLYLFEAKYVFAGIKDLVFDSVEIESNEFMWSLDDADKGYYFVRSKPKQIFDALYLIPGDTLSVKYTKNQAYYSGKTAYLEEYEREKRHFFESDSLFIKYSRLYQLLNLEFNKAMSIIDTMYSRELRFYNHYFEGKFIPEEYKKILLAKITHEIAFKYLNVYNGYNYDKEKTDCFASDSSLYVFLEEIEPDIKYNYQSGLFSYFLDYFLSDLFIRTYGLYNKELKGKYLRKSKVSELKFKTNWIRDHLKGLHHDFGFHSMYKNEFGNAFNDSTERFYRDIEEIHSYFAKKYTDSNIYNECNIIYKDYMKLKPGEKAPSLDLPDTSGKIISLDNYIGNVIYLDFWGTWCPSCIRHIPDQIELQNTFKGKGVVFINIALGFKNHNKDIWKKFLEEHYFPGIHVFHENQLDNITQFKPYKMSGGAPLYVLIDKNGEIALPKAPGPSEVLSEINKLLLK